MFDFKSAWRHWSTWLWGAALCALGAALMLPDGLIQVLPGLMPGLPPDWQQRAALALGLAGFIAKFITQAGVQARIKRLRAWLASKTNAGAASDGSVRRNIAAAGGVMAAALVIAAPLVKALEGYSAKPYVDIAGVLTTCYGHTGADIVAGRRYDAQACSDLLNDDLAAHGYTVLRCAPGLGRDAHALAAWTSFDYNTGAFCSAKSRSMTAARAAIAAGRIKASCAQMDLWVYAGGRKLSGLVRRRATERALCEGRA